MRHFIFTFLFSLSVISAFAQDSRQMFNHLNVGLTAGTTGIGLDVATPVTRWLQLRAGFAYMPEFKAHVDFGLQAYQDGKLIATNFAHMQELMKGFTGLDVDQEVEMIGRPTMFNGKLMVDFFPWQDKGWHLTVGFYYGSSRVARAINAMTEMSSLLAVNIYNSFYDKDFLYEPVYGDVYLDPDKAMALREKFDTYGRMGVHMGDYPDGTPYMLTPHSDGTVSANMHVNRFKPYMGVGYQGAIGTSKKWTIGFDCGVMMWGGTPRLVTHDGIDLINDVVNVPGKVGSYARTMSDFKVWPVLNFRIAYAIF